MAAKKTLIPPIRILVTGFEPFGGEVINPAWDVVQRLPEQLDAIHIEKLCLPTAFKTSRAAIAKAIDQYTPNAVLCLGQAGGRTALSVERVAINLDDAPAIADNAGDRPVDRPIVQRGAAAYFATVPIKAMVAAIRAQGIPAEVSNSAGTFVCNHVMYSVLHHVRRRHGNAIRAGFMHVPFLPQQAVGRPVASMSADDMLAGTCAALLAIATHAIDVEVSAGLLH
jgi:pyroglutamyl-peptidase